MDETLQMQNSYAADLARARAADAAATKQQAPAKANPTGGSKSRINIVNAAAMIGFGLLVDAAQAFLNLIPWLGAIISIIIGILAGAVFCLWLMLVGITWWQAKNMKTLLLLLGVFGLEVTPFFNALPAWTGFAIGAVLNEYAGAILAGVPLIGKLAAKKQSANEPKTNE